MISGREKWKSAVHFIPQSFTNDVSTFRTNRPHPQGLQRGRLLGQEGATQNRLHVSVVSERFGFTTNINFFGVLFQSLCLSVLLG
jgi:hypothetical protein